MPPQDVPKTPSGRPKTPPRRPQDAPRRPQERPRRSQEAPKTSPRRPKSAQDAPKTPPNAFKTPQEASKNKRRSNGKGTTAPRDAQITSRPRFWNVLEWFGKVLWSIVRGSTSFFKGFLREVQGNIFDPSTTLISWVRLGIAPRIGPRRPHDAPRRPQDAPRGLWVNAPRRQTIPKTPSNAPKYPIAYKKQQKKALKKHHRPKRRSDHLQTTIL